MRTAMMLISAATTIWFCTASGARSADMFGWPERQRLDRQRIAGVLIYSCAFM